MVIYNETSILHYISLPMGINLISELETQREQT